MAFLWGYIKNFIAHSKDNLLKRAWKKILSSSLYFGIGIPAYFLLRKKVGQDIFLKSHYKMSIVIFVSLLSGSALFYVLSKVGIYLHPFAALVSILLFFLWGSNLIKAIFGRNAHFL
jgi:uncharacterized membrane protein